MALITPHHQAQYMAHNAAIERSEGHHRFHDLVHSLCQKHQCRTVLDYGSGPQIKLERTLGGCLMVESYDPGVPDLNALPGSADLVVALDVLEHVEPMCLDEVIRHIEELAQRVILLNISTQASTKTLPDGSPWHTIVQDKSWWLDKLPRYEVLDDYSDGRDELTLLKVLV